MESAPSQTAFSRKNSFAAVYTTCYKLYGNNWPTYEINKLIYL